MFFAAETWPFTVATFLILLIAVVEGLAMLVGASLSEWLNPSDSWSLSHSPLDRALDWLYIGRVPILVLLVAFLAAFAVCGFAVNLISHRFLGAWTSVWLSIPLASIAALPIVRGIAAGLARLIPQDETFAVSFESLIGRVGLIVNGTARAGYPAQARVNNEHGQALYVLVEPEAQDMTFQAGEHVLLQKQIAGNRFTAIVNPWPDLLAEPQRSQSRE